jgi:hypothetical protein
MLLSLLRQGPDVVDTDLSKYFGTSEHILSVSAQPWLKLDFAG